MSRLAHRLFVLVGFTLAFAAGRAEAQDNRDAGKKPAELFANDCSGCHKSPAGLAKSPGMFGLESFLREHYTASRQSATLIANYLRSIDAEQGAAATSTKRRKSEPKQKGDKPSARPNGKPDSSESKADAKKPDAKADARPAGEKPAEPKATETKPAESTPAESKPAETKPPAESSSPAATQEKSN